MFAIIVQDGVPVAKETPHYSKMSDDIDVQLSKSVPVILVMAIEDVQSLGIDPETVQLDGEPTAAPASKAPVKEEPAK